MHRIVTQLTSSRTGDERRRAGRDSRALVARIPPTSTAPTAIANALSH